MNRIFFENLETEAKDIDSKLTKLCETEKEIHNLYRGTSMWFSPIVENPDVMFLGINPGAAFYNNNDQTLCHFYEPLKIMEYVDPSQSYKLKWEWQYVFGEKGLNRMDVLGNSVKTNFCYLATQNYSALIKLFSQMRVKLGIAPYEVFGNWTRNVVQQVNPKLLICEGKKSLELLKTWSFKDEYEAVSSVAGMEIGQIGNIKVLQVSRIFSTIKNADKVIEVIGELLK